MEQQQELKLHAATQQVARVQYRIEVIRKQIQIAKIQFVKSLESGTTSAELRILNDTLALYRQTVGKLTKDLLHFETLRNEQLGRYREERRRREILENLRTQSFEAYRRKIARQEQRRADDLFLMRHARQQQG